MALRSAANARGSRGLRGAPGPFGPRVSQAARTSEVASWQLMRIDQMIAARRIAAASSVTTTPSENPAVAAAAAAPAPAPSAPPAAPAPDVTACDFRVGHILNCAKHPDADSLYVEQIDVGEPEPRTIVSGLVEYVSLDAMQGRSVVVICNLKPRNMRGVKSHGMVLCASDDAHSRVEPLTPPAEAPAGERVWFGEAREQPAPAEPNRVQKKKIWEAVQPLLRTDAEGVAAFQGRPMLTSAGPVTATGFANASIS